MSRSSDHDDAAHAALRRVRREGRWWWLQARHARRVWRWAVPTAVLVFVLLALLRGPLANWFWNEPQVEQLLDQGDRALAAGRLSAADGSGARESYQAALALDGDRNQARNGLARTAQAALQQARDALAAGDLDAAGRALALARELQVPQRDADVLAEQLRARRGAQAGVAVLLGRAEAALLAQRLDGSEDAALPLFQKVLAVAPNQLRALEGREDALSDLLQQARQSAAAGQLARSAGLVQRARRYDAGHVDLPATQEALNNALEQRLRQAERALRRQRWDAAAADFQAVLAALPDDPVARLGLQRVAEAQLARAVRLAGDFRFDQADQALQTAQSLGAAEAGVAQARQAVAQARQAQRALKTPSAPRAQRERALAILLERITDAEAQGHFLTPPGRSAYDALREAQALAAGDARVRAAAQRLLPGTRRCFEDRLRENRVQAAGACLEAWQVLAHADPALAPARQRLAQRWLAIGSERLGSGDLDFARRALQQADALGVDPSTSDYHLLQQRLRDIEGVR